VPKKKLLIIMVSLLVALTVVVILWRNSDRFFNNGELELSGVVEATEVQVSSKVTGKVINRAVDEGDSVEKGTLICEIESPELLAQLRQAQAAEETARQYYYAMSRGSRPQQISQAIAMHKQAEAAFIDGEADYERVKKLYEERVASKSQFDATKARYEGVKEQLRIARDNLSLVNEGPRKEEVLAARAQSEQARAALDFVRSQVAELTIYAPLKGTVMVKEVEKGELVTPGSPIVTLADLDKVWVKLYVMESDLGKVSLNAKVRITIDSFSDREFEGVITHISEKAEFTPKNIQTKDERVNQVYAVKVTIPNPEGILKPGMYADAKIKVK
jgi:HlyD family secretion protein